MKIVFIISAILTILSLIIGIISTIIFIWTIDDFYRNIALTSVVSTLIFALITDILTSN